jgi:hypothetical protein
MAMVVMFPILNNTMYPTSFLIYIFVSLCVTVSQWWDFLKSFVYFE